MVYWEMNNKNKEYPFPESGHYENGQSTNIRYENGEAADYSRSCKKSNSASAQSFQQNNKKRGEWGNKIQFFLAIMGYSVGIGSVWRFPITCCRNGGGAFLIPFFFFFITAGGPLYYMEVCLGQFTGKSACLAFEFCPLLKGVGPLQVTLCLIVIWYTICVLVWAIYFLYNSFSSTLPWTTCSNKWNTQNCQATSELWTNHPSNTTMLPPTNEALQNRSEDVSGSSMNTPMTDFEPQKYSSSALEFWQYNAVGRSAGLEDLGGFQIHLVICLFLAWFFVVLGVLKGTKTLGKVVYVTATVPYLFLGIMLVRGVTLDGASDGIIAYVKPDFNKLLTLKVWLEAAIQVFYSLGPTWGGVITMASYNRFHHKNFRVTTLCVATAGFASFFNGLVVFAILGFMAREARMAVQEVASVSGPGLGFVAFPTALSHMPIPQFCSALFFSMLVTVVFGSLFGMFETVTCGIIDVFPKQLTSKRVLVSITTGLVFFVVGLPFTLNGGIYIFQLADWYFASFALLLGSALEAIGICWFYGTDRFSRDIEMMTGRRVSILLRITWSLIIPVFVITTFLILLTRNTLPDYGDNYDYPSYSIAIAICTSLSPIVVMVGIAVKELLRTQGSVRKRMRQVITPTHLWQPNDHEARKAYLVQPYRYPDGFWTLVGLNVFGPKKTPLL